MHKCRMNHEEKQIKTDCTDELSLYVVNSLKDVLDEDYPSESLSR